jgi:hypothetical protein
MAEPGADIEEAQPDGEPAAIRQIGAAVRGDQTPSLADELRANRRALRGKRTTTIDLPGFPRLAVRYKAVDLQAIDKIQERARKAGTNVAYIHAAADIIGTCCEEILARDDKEDLRPLNEQRAAWGDDPIRFDERFAELLEVEHGSVRINIENVFGAFEPDTGNDIVMMDHAEEIVLWIKSGARESEPDF